ncbi:hypothetical protein MPTK1_8g12980 [Marchantia polymorpha subsp. ruderalis]|uniref:VASt domain-containing protein n=2 Tax=Marchantia polymorpha TaxID=3197 RepID=A0A176W6D9_MARPO|nr:hypothetical protein AXG93_223s1190 [Marchantia polymorpha subsp. ruderalis]PTQ34054.1 hypothetical protein MARPO_0083s0023 [Marchantia polymorpha]BBN19713.1 hypothetical protein Mp_8g12980 [Marchantia polymorpha subsp. ruderalis]|eukprot:PTQ34054.1 hypothetical protein MARPO_0083s0023 [Marchantia polymorpha]
MPIDGEIGEDPTPSDTAAVELRRRVPGEGAEGRFGQLMENNGLKNSVFGLVQYFMDRPENQSQSSGSSSPKTMLGSVWTTPATESVLLASTDTVTQVDSSSSPTAGPELVKNEVFSDGEKSGPLHSQSQQRLEAQQSQNNRTYLKSEEYRQLFHLPPEEVLIEDFNCALQKKILLQGHMYLFEQYVCFYSNIFGYEKKKVIPLKDVTCVRKAKTAGVFPNAIEITGWGKKHFFASFLSRDEAFRLIVNGWSQHSGYARKFLGANFSPVSSPPSQGRVSIDSAIMSLAWRSPQRAASLPIDGTFSPRDMEDVPNLVAPSVQEEPRDESMERSELEDTSERGNATDAVEPGFEETVVVNGDSSVSGASTSTVWEPEDLDAPVMPDGYKTVVESEFAVDVEEFFQLFFSDDAIGFLKQFHGKCGDDDFRCTEWAKHRHFGRARDISFRHPINFYFGPKATYCHESQRFRVYRNSHLVLETSQQMTDIPYGDYFRVEVRWDVEKLFGRGSNHCFVRVSLGVSFCKKTVWKGKIEQGTYDESKEAYTTWICEAHALLRDMRALDAGVNPIEDSAVLLSPEPRESLGEVANIANRAISAEVEPSDRRIHEVEHINKTAPDVEEFRTKELNTAIYGRDWAKKSSAILGTMLLVSQRIWEKGYNLDFKASKQLKYLCFILIAVVVVLMQIGIILVLARTPKLQYVPVGYQSSPANVRGCFGELSGEDALAWLEQRTRNIKQEIIMAESRLQTLHQDLNILKMHASKLLGFVDVQSTHFTSPE